MKFFVLSGLLLALSCLSGRANLTIKSLENPPEAMPALACAASGEGDIRWYYTSDSPVARRDVGQVLIPDGPMEIGQLVLSVASHENALGSNTPGAPVTLRWYEYNGAELLADSKPVAEYQAALPQDLSAGQHLVFKFPKVKLTAGTSYLVILSFDEAVAGQYLNFAISPTRSYPEGKLVFQTVTKADPDLHYEEFKANLVFALMKE